MALSTSFAWPHPLAIDAIYVIPSGQPPSPHLFINSKADCVTICALQITWHGYSRYTQMHNVYAAIYCMGTGQNSNTLRPPSERKWGGGGRDYIVFYPVHFTSNLDIQLYKEIFFISREQHAAHPFVKYQDQNQKSRRRDNMYQRDHHSTHRHHPHPLIERTCAS